LAETDTTFLYALDGFEVHTTGLVPVGEPTAEQWRKAAEIFRHTTEIHAAANRIKASLGADEDLEEIVKRFAEELGVEPDSDG
jgi:hypothetical protein